ncbi:MAG: hypothetical protein ACLSUM_00285 [Dysosmobacter welbionis]
MRGRIITSDHRIFALPVLLRWNITYTGGVPCDSYGSPACTTGPC